MQVKEVVASYLLTDDTWFVTRSVTSMFSGFKDGSPKRPSDLPVHKQRGKKSQTVTSHPLYLATSLTTVSGVGSDPSVVQTYLWNQTETLFVPHSISLSLHPRHFP